MHSQELGKLITYSPPRSYTFIYILPYVDMG